MSEEAEATKPKRKRKTPSPAAATDGVEPLLVSVSLGATIPTGDYASLRPEVRIQNIRLDQDVDTQVKTALEAAAKAWVAIDTEIEVQVSDMVASATGKPEGVREQLDELQQWRKKMVDPSIRNIAEKVRELAGKPEKAVKPSS